LIKLIEKIEGEAKLHFSFDKNKKIDFVEIEFFNSRNIEEILKNRPVLDSLVINPRVCGICGHAHLQATAKAIEDCYEDLIISKKAEIIRELTLNFELIQNHFKWFYLNLLPLFGQKQYILKATKPSSTMAKAIALFGGQYPHNSYAIVGGITSEPTPMDLVKAKNFIDEVIVYFQEHIITADLEEVLNCKDIDKLLKKDGDLPSLLRTIKKKNWQNKGKSFDRFIVFGENSYFKKGKSIHTVLNENISTKYIKEQENKNSLAKNVIYKDKYYEVGPLSRAMVNKTPLIKEAHRRYKDSIFTRILARVCEIIQLLNHSKELIKEINLQEPSFIEPKIEISKLSGKGIGTVEAARGSLVHEVEIEQGIIKNYTIITPTQWNLSNGTKISPATSQKAMIGLEDTELAEIVFKTFDVCSVCTTH